MSTAYRFAIFKIFNIISFKNFFKIANINKLEHFSQLMHKILVISR